MLEKCTICPHKCGIDRNKYIGRCKSNNKIKIALYSTHNFEEPCISGENRFWYDFLFKLQYELPFLPKLRNKPIGQRKRDNNRRTC